MKEIFKFPDVLESIKMSVFIFQHKNILIKENIYLADDRERMKLEVVNWYLFCLSWLEVILKLSWLYYAYGAHLLNDKNLLTIYIYISRLVLTYGCFQENLFEIVKITNWIRRQVYFFKMVVSQLDSDLTAIVKNEFRTI